MPRAPRSSAAAVVTPVKSRDTAHLSIQIDVTADNAAELIAEVRRRKNDALMKGDLATADQLDDLSIRLTDQYVDLIRHDLKTIDNSQQMRDAIKGFADANAKIDDAIKTIKTATEFAQAVTLIAGLLDQLIASTLVSA